MARGRLSLVILSLLYPLVAVGAPPSMRVTLVRVDGNASAGARTGVLVLRAMLDDSGGSGTLQSSLLTGALTIQVDDAQNFHFSSPVTGCRAAGSGIRCSFGQAHLKLKRTSSPNVYRLRLSVQSMTAQVTGVGRPTLPIRLTIIEPNAADRIDVISDCMAPGTRRLACRDRDRPNIVFVVSDDQRWDTLQYMPQTIARLGDQGVTFTNGFVTTPLCSPSRSTMLTGLYARNHGVRTNASPNGGAERFVGPDASTIATWLHDAGYRTGMIGKYMTGYAGQCPPSTARCYIPPGWDDWRVFLSQGYYNYQLAENDSIVSYGNSEAEYSTDVITAKAVDFIQNAHGQHFFLHVGYHAPHSEGGALPIPALRHAGTFRGRPPFIPPTLPPWLPPSYDEDDVSDKPPWMADLARADDTIGTIRIGSYFEAGRLLQLETLLALDEGIGAIADALEATGQTENTVFVFVSDNGYFWGEHRLFAGKDYPYQESLRVPLIVRYPRRVAGGRSDDRFVLNADLAPTLAELAGVVPATATDGQSFAPLLTETNGAWRDAFAFEWFGFGAEALQNYVGVFAPEWQYISYPDVSEAELYDLSADPYQLDNVVEIPTNAATVAELQNRLVELLP